MTAVTAATPATPTTPDRPVVRVRDLTKRFRRADGAVVHAADRVSLDVMPGQMVVLVGPSGCGKTTLLRSIAGLERPDEGLIEVHGETYFSSERQVHVPPERRRVSMVFQSYALWPHMTAFQNVAYPLRAGRRRRVGRAGRTDRRRTGQVDRVGQDDRVDRVDRIGRVGRAEVADKVHHMLSLLGIAELAGQHPHQMSGGQRQRVALARALVAGSDLVLFDEPLSNVDAKVRTKLRIELLSMQRELRFSALFVTHDQVEAMELAHTIAVMASGRVAQSGSPQEVYEHPRSRGVASFIGTTNEVEGKVTACAGGEVRVHTGLGEVVGVPGTGGLAVGARVVAVWRPERTRLLTTRPDGPNRWEGTIRTAMYVGSHTEHAVECGGCQFRVWRPDALLSDEGATRWLSVAPAHVRVLPASDDDADVDVPARERGHGQGQGQGG